MSLCDECGKMLAVRPHIFSRRPGVQSLITWCTISVECHRSSSPYQFTVRPPLFLQGVRSRTEFSHFRHQKSESYKCECGKRFLDPARRSRCRASHSKSFGCPAEDCNYRYVDTSTTVVAFSTPHLLYIEATAKTLLSNICDVGIEVSRTSKS